MSAPGRSLAGVPCVVLGAGGFIGTHLCQALARAGSHVRGFGRSPAFPAALPAIEFTVAEFSDTPALARVVEGAEIVFHLIGGTDPAASNADPSADLRSDVLPSIGLLQLCRESGVSKIVFVSSGGTVYGVPAAIPIAETAPTQPISAYGINKLTVEKYLALFAYIGGPRSMSLRVSNPFGPYQSRFGQQGLIATLIQSVLSERAVEIWGDGQSIRDYLYVEDLAKALMTASLYDGPESVVNVGSGVGRSVLEVLDSVCTVLGRRPPAVVHKPARRSDVPVNVLDVTRARHELGWRPTTSWLEGLRRTAEWVAATRSPRRPRS